MFKLLPKKKYQDMLDTLKDYEDKFRHLEAALDNTDKCLCDVRQQKYDLNLALEYANESYALLDMDYKNLEKELKSQKKTNRRLINLLYNPKKK